MEMSLNGAWDDLERSLEFLRARGADRLVHSNRCLLDHLIGTRRLLLDWGARPRLCSAGLFHSVYGTEHFETPCVPISQRSEVRGLIGNEAEHLAWLFCVMRRATFDENLTREDDFRVQHRMDGTWHSLSQQEFSDLANLSAANALEALPHLSWFERQRLRRACKSYLSLFDRFLLPPARRAVDAACVPWWNIWA